MRPRRLYKTKKDKYYYIIDGKRKYIKLGEGISQKQIVRINIKNIPSEGRRLKKRRKRKTVKYVIPRAGISSFRFPKTSLPTPTFDFKDLLSMSEFSKPKIELIGQENLKSLEKMIKDKDVETVSIIKKALEQLENKPVQPLALPFPKPSISAGSIETDTSKRIDITLKRLKELSSTKPSQTTTPMLTPMVEPTYYSGEAYADVGMGGAEPPDGLWNDEIDKILKSKIQDTVPIIANDQVSKLLPYVKPNMKRFGFVINRASSTSDGTGKDGNEVGHWMACYINNEDDFPSVEWYDSLAEGNPPEHIISTLKQISEKINPERYFKFKVNNLKLQPDKSPRCGYYAIKFLEDRYNGIPFEEASGYKQFIEKYGKKFQEEKDKEIKKYKSYL